MVTLTRGPNWKIAVYGREHGVPHFHVEGPGFRCSVALSDLSVLVGSAPTAVLKAARVWALDHGQELAATWQEMNG